jgi:hypothetical protein
MSIVKQNNRKVPKQSVHHQVVWSPGCLSATVTSFALSTSNLSRSFTHLFERRTFSTRARSLFLQIKTVNVYLLQKANFHGLTFTNSIILSILSLSVSVALIWYLIFLSFFSSKLAELWCTGNSRNEGANFLLTHSTSQVIFYQFQFAKWRLHIVKSREGRSPKTSLIMDGARVVFCIKRVLLWTFCKF